MYINTFLHLLKQVRTLTAAGERRQSWRKINRVLLPLDLNPRVGADHTKGEEQTKLEKN